VLAVPAQPASAATSANVWLTTADRGNLLRQQGSVPFGSGGSGPMITVDPNATHQSMVGFGASFTDAAAWNVSQSPRRDEIMNALFNPSSGVGLGFLRQPIGAAARRWTADAGRLVDTGAGKCLDATGVSSVDGTPLQTWSCSTGANQQWVLLASVPAAGPCPQGPFGNPLPSPALTATKIRDGFNFLEGPAWDAASQTLLLTNMHDGTGAENVQPSDILRFTPSTGAFTTFVAGAGSNGLAVSRDGKSVYAATHDQRSVSAYDLATGRRTTVAADYQGHLFNSPNDVTEGADGTVYFTDPDFQRANRPDRMSGKTGVFRVRGGVVTLIDDTIREPNGIELSPDGKSLYVGGNATGKIYRYPVGADGGTGSRSDFASLAGTDGGTVDCAGNVYQVTFGDGKVHVFSPAGQALGTISAGPNTTNVAFGGPDRTTLYLTSGTPSGGGDSGNFALYSVRLNVPGWPY
jgi:gluconolactonase